MFSSTTVKGTLLLLLGTGLLALGFTQATPAASQDDAAAKIENAMSAAPSSVSATATILDWEMDDAGKFVVLQDGSNGWFCLPDDPTTPSDDPMCVDQAWLDWVYAFAAGKEPPTQVAGLAYMLQGGTAASNTDPAATEPAAGEDWITDPPHVRVILPDDLDQDVFSTDHASGQPYIMWAGTHYEHIMMPVADGEHTE
jgi:hypothetical protein